MKENRPKIVVSYAVERALIKMEYCSFTHISIRKILKTGKLRKWQILRVSGFRITFKSFLDFNLGFSLQRGIPAVFCPLLCVGP